MSAQGGLLADKVVVVSGVGPGLGRSICLRAAAEGARVVLAARTESRLKEVAAEIDAAAVPYLPGARESLAEGFVPGGSKRNLDWVRPHLDGSGVDEDELIAALKEGRIDVGFGRLHHNDPNVAGILMREERLALAIPQGTPFADDTSPLPLSAIAGQKLIVYPKEPRPSYADHVLSLLHAEDVRPAEVHEVREIQSALGLVASDAGLCIVPSSARQVRSDLHYRMIEGERATSPVILNHRVGDNSRYIELIKALIVEMYAENPPWLGLEHNLPFRPSFVK